MPDRRLDTAELLLRWSILLDFIIVAQSAGKKRMWSKWARALRASALLRPADRTGDEVQQDSLQIKVSSGKNFRNIEDDGDKDGLFLGGERSG